MKQYEIVITHKDGPCPELPKYEGLRYNTDEYDTRKCPVHVVFAESCPIWKPRYIIEKLLFYMPGVQSISLYYGGERKTNDCYERDPLSVRNWIHVY